MALWKRRQRCAERYAKGLADVPELTLPHRRPEVQHAWHLYVIQLDVERLCITRKQFIEQMGERGVATGVHYVPLHLHPYYRDVWGARPEDFPVATAAYERIVSLPIHSQLSVVDVDIVIESVKDVIAQNAR